MTQKEILYFEKAMETKNISLAAEQMYVSRSVISRSIQELEEEFGVTLFERSKSGIEPTEAGTMLLGMIREARGCYEALVNRFKHLGETNFQRSLNVGVTPTNCRIIARTLYGPFHQKHPDIHIRLFERYSDELLELLRQGKVDIVVSPAYDPEYVSLGYLDLYMVQLVVGVRKDHPLARKEILSARDLLDQPLGFLGSPIPRVQDTIQAAFELQGSKPNTVVRTSDLKVLEELTCNGQLLSILPDDLMTGWEDVSYIPMDFCPKKSIHRLCWNKAVPLTAAESDLISFMKGYFANYQGERVEKKPEPKKEKPEAAQLSESFYAELLGLPSCKTRGYCDNCGRCEH